MSGAAFPPPHRLEAARLQLADAAAYALEHFYYLDKANATVHMSPVRFSPITFALAEALEGIVARGPVIDDVLEHRGRYPLDRGRVENDPV